MKIVQILSAWDMEVHILKRNVLLGYLCVSLSAVLWGAIPIFSRQLYAIGCTPQQVSSTRSYLAALLSLLALIFCRKIGHIRLKDIPYFLCYGIFAIGLTFFFYATSTRLLPTAMAAILLYTGPAFVNILNRIFYKDPITHVKLMALLCTFSGCALVVRVYDFSSFESNLVGIVIGLLSGLCYSMTTVLSRKAGTVYTGKTKAWLIMLFGSLPFFFIQPPTRIPMHSVNQAELFVLLAVIGSFIPYTLYLHGLDYGIDKGSASIVATIEPVAATIFGVIVFGDRLEIIQLIGIMIVLVGVILPIIYDRAKQLARDKTGDSQQN